MSERIRSAAKAAREASRTLGLASEAQRNAALEAVATALESNRKAILEANERDQTVARRLVANGELAPALADRLKVSAHKLLREICPGVRSVQAQADPIGKTQMATELDKGLKLYRISVPIGVIGVIFESRPDALVQIASLCMKSGNAVLLKGGSEAKETNRALAKVILEATHGLDGIPDGWMVPLEAREDVRAILALDDVIDLIIPRGSNALVRSIMQNTKIPVLGHADGLCHVYVDRDADLDDAIAIAIDAKTQYPAVCNAAETLLVHREIARAFLPAVVRRYQEMNVEVRADRATRRLVGNGVIAATEADWDAEYLDLIISIKIVDDLEEAIGHINTHSSHHTDAIVTRDRSAAKRFLQKVDSASVVHNASTRFADGYRFGLGAEVGISTNRIHSRGPVGLEGLVIYKYIVEGGGQTVGDYVGENAASFRHAPLSESWDPPG